MIYKTLLIVLTVFIATSCTKEEFISNLKSSNSRPEPILVDDQYNRPVKWLMVKEYRESTPTMPIYYKYNDRYILDSTFNMHIDDTIAYTVFESNNDKIEHSEVYLHDSSGGMSLMLERFYIYDEDLELVEFAEQWFNNGWEEENYIYNSEKDTVWTFYVVPGGGRPLDPNRNVLHQGMATTTYYSYLNPNPIGRMTSPIMGIPGNLRHTYYNPANFNEIIIDSVVDGRVYKISDWENGIYQDSYIYEWKPVYFDIE